MWHRIVLMCTCRFATRQHFCACVNMQSINACACKRVCIYSLLLLHSCLFNILAYCISCGEEPDFPSMVLDCMITVMILNLVLILNKSSIQFILVNFSDRQLQILKKKKKKFYPSLYTIIFLCNILRLCWCALCHSFLQRGSGFFVIWTHLYLIHDICWSIKVFKYLILRLCTGISLRGWGFPVLSPFAQQIMEFSLNDLDYWGLCVVLLHVWFCLL